ncbi:MAG: cytochrome c oxidase subunit II [Ignavibacteriae bacterium]|nr:cytochrome c oxidase subunit II [Ignavibacteriota bacterium]
MKELLGLPIDASAHGPELDSLTVIVHWLMLVLFVGWGLYFLYTLFRFRQSRNPVANYHGTKSKISTYGEVAVAIVEIVLIVGFAVPLWSQRVDDFPDEKDATVIRVVAEQFAWNAHYAGKDGIFGRTDIKLVTAENPLGIDREDPDAKDDIFTINNLNFPVNKPVIIYLSSKDVIHSFGLPLFRVKQDAIPGERIPLWFIPTMTSDEIRESMTWEMSTSDTVRYQNLAVMDNYIGTDSTVLASKRDFLTQETMDLLKQTGIESIKVSMDVPTEIACAQLCGLGHFRMRGSVNSMTQQGFDEWLEVEASYLQQ